jgi:hypothetical protein
LYQLFFTADTVTEKEKVCKYRLLPPTTIFYMGGRPWTCTACDQGFLSPDLGQRSPDLGQDPEMTPHHRGTTFRGSSLLWQSLADFWSLSRKKTVGLPFSSGTPSAWLICCLRHSMHRVAKVLYPLSTKCTPSLAVTDSTFYSFLNVKKNKSWKCAVRKNSKTLKNFLLIVILYNNLIKSTKTRRKGDFLPLEN